LTELETRIRGRGTETEENIQRRLRSACSEIEIGRHYKYIVVNDTVEMAADKIAAIIMAEHCQVDRNIDLIEMLEHTEGK